MRCLRSSRYGCGLLPVAAFAVAVTGCAVTASPSHRPPAIHVSGSAQVPAVCPQPDACVSAAIDSIAAGAVGAARERLDAIRREWPGTPWAGRAALLTAKLSLDHDPAAALVFSLQAEDDLPILGDHAVAIAAEASRRIGRRAEAAAYFETLARRYPESTLAPSAWWAAADVWAAIDGRQSDALTALFELADRFPDDTRTPAALARIISLGAAAGRPSDGAAACRRLLSEFAASSEAASVLARCRDIPNGSVAALSFAEQRRRAEGLARAAKFSDALDVWTRLKPSAPTAHLEREVDLQIGITFYRLKRWEEAGRAFRRVAASDAGPALREEARLWEGRAAFRRDDDRALRRAEVALAASAPDSPRRLELIALRAASHRFARNNEAAIAAYRELARAATALGRPDKTVEASWNIGWIEYRRGRAAQAREAFAQALETAAPSDPQIPQLLYWMSRLERGNDADREPSDPERALTTKFPYTYYGLLARRVGLDPGASGAPPSTDAEAARGSDGGFTDRTAELARLGWRNEAREELLLATRRTPPASDRALKVADALAVLGADDEALRIVRRHFAPGLERGDVALAPTVWRRAYPNHLLTAIRSRAEDRVDPFLVAGLIREESVYDARALSPVGAIGLMQLMPETGRRVARQVGLADFAVEHLYTPEVNLTLGVRYLADLLDRFSGNEAYAVAAYNAGPEAVTRWLEAGPPRSIEEFIEEIPFSETRGYVKRVLRSAWVYRGLYGASPEHPVHAAR
ncbi:MAG: transglycosylase SLT domain-containing protein [Nitrospirota bacterium]